jgi:hypothetical protein
MASTRVLEQPARLNPAPQKSQVFVVLMTAICVWKFLKLTVLIFLELTVAMVQSAVSQHVSQFLLVLVV